MHFVAKPADSDIVAAIERLYPENPFATNAYFESRRRLWYEGYVLGVEGSSGALVQGCGAFLRTGRLNKTLEIISSPKGEGNESFWPGVRDFCRKHGVTQLELETYASPPGTDAPLLSPRGERRERCELILDLTSDPTAQLSSNHRRNVKKGQKSGLTMLRARSADAAAAHEALIGESMSRRRLRGESVPDEHARSETEALLASGAGELFQAVRGETVVSSVLVLSASEGAYYQSAGTSPEGMEMGASHFLIHGIALELKAGGARSFNLGGADANSTLQRFKEGFGAHRSRSSATSCYVGPSWRRAVQRAGSLARSGRNAARAGMAIRSERMLVYAADVGRASTLTETTGSLALRPMTEEEINALGVDGAFKARQLDRLRRFGKSYAFGVFSNGDVAHISWLLPAAAMQKDVPHVIPAREFAAEITGCETLPAFRGRGIYAFAIRNLLEVARREGARRVFMKTTPDNHASRSGIEKAGLERVGTALIFTLPITGRQVVWRRFR